MIVIDAMRKDHMTLMLYFTVNVNVNLIYILTAITSTHRSIDLCLCIYLDIHVKQ